MPSESPRETPGIPSAEPSRDRVLYVHEIVTKRYPGITSADARAKREAMPMGTNLSQRWLSVELELERLEPWVAKEPRPEVARWVWLLTEAFTSAVDLVKQTRGGEPVSGEAFARVAARVDGLWPLAKAERALFDVKGWPNDPQAVAWFTEPSMADAIVRFTRAMNTALLIGTDGPRDKRRLLSDPWNDGYRDRFAAELETHLLPRAEFWGSMGVIHREYGLAVHKLEAEYSAWAEAQREGAASPALKAGAGGRSWQEAMPLAEQAVKDAGGVWPKRGNVWLCEQVGCSRGTMHKAVKASRYLSALKATAGACAGSVRTDGKATARLEAGELEQQREADPAKLAEQHELDRLIEEQQQDDQREKRGRA